MTVDQILTLGGDLAHVNTDQVPTASRVIDLNNVYHDFLSGIRQYVSEDHFLDIWKTDAISGQTNGEYVFPTQDGTNAGMSKLKQLYVKPRSTDTYYVKATQVDVRTLPYDWDWYLTNQPMDAPIYFVADNSFFLAPNFTDETAGDAGNEQIELYGVKQEVDLASGGAETTILVPREYHSVLAKGVKAYCYARIGKDAEQRVAFAEYEAEKQKAYSELSDRDISEGQAMLPDDTHLQY